MPKPTLDELMRLERSYTPEERRERDEWVGAWLRYEVEELRDAYMIAQGAHG